MISPTVQLEDMRTLEGIDTLAPVSPVHVAALLEDMRTLEGIDTFIKFVKNSNSSTG